MKTPGFRFGVAAKHFAENGTLRKPMASDDNHVNSQTEFSQTQIQIK